MSRQDQDAAQEVVFRRSGLTVRWDPACQTLLELAFARGLNPPHSCRDGGCNSCLTRLVEGEVDVVLEVLAGL